MTLTVARKLTLAFGIVAVAAGGLGALAFVEASNVVSAAQEVEAGLDAEHRREEALGRLSQALLAGEAAARDQIAAGDAGAADRVRSAGVDLSGAIADLRELAPEQAPRLDRIAALDASYRDEMGTLADLAADPKTRGQALDAALTSTGMSEMRALEGEVRLGIASAAAESITVAASRIQAILTFGTAIVFAATVLVALAMMRSLAKPIRGMAEAMKRLSAGARDVAVPGLGRADEIGAMAAAVEVFRADRARAETARAEADEVRRMAEEERAMRGEDTARVADLLEAALTRLADGDLTARVTETFPGRYARLGDQFNAAAERLHSTLGQVSASVVTINNGVTEIGHAADDLARRTEQQAASLDTTATALDEITATVKHSADNAVSVAGSVAAARLDTERSGDVMREAVESMTGIQKSSQQIARIIGVIDEIAFQTNLLALNAGVEAARAGEAGRGFAVVALEVRALAQRSSEAAKEIKALIGTSTAQVGAGVSLVNRAGEALTRIAAQVTQIDSLVQEIAGSAKEQSVGIGDVNEAVNKMDRVTQQNAAMVEETTAATLSLRSQTEELGRLISSFRTDADGASVAQLRRMGQQMREAVSPRAAEPAAPRARPVPAIVAVAASGGGMSAAMRAAEPQAQAAADLGWEEF
ncbi:methyl-accepting chemotaxis protein [Antarcticirhabdus aurantiaca]|uniref:Methyl-accepting chemotaxis protein n=1 Tax=Antarcticirhabdus aurantiaca TaxID=2606717 RepID=A0ACD4NST2_9HYPH|nr:methyl-accepting chemotaxis protein [Antarcticirhabdus aurantiaca]WAJ29839.1 methyl-accepting chemotaxis protein [Jeongeuplla avenae]